jgi:hypothetical protein
MVSIGGGKQSSSSSSTVWDQQTPFLQDLYSQAQSAYGDNSGGASQYATNFSNQNQQTGNTALDNLMDTSYINSIQDGSNLGMQTMQTMMNPNGNPYLDNQINYAQQNIGRNLKENILPGVASEAGITGNYGGSRQGIAEGMAMQEALRQGTQLDSTMRGNAYSEDMNRAGNAANSYVGQQLNADDQMINKMGAAGNQMNDNYNLGMNKFNVPWQQLNNYSDIIGSPTMTSTGSSSGWNISGGYSPPK